jgi:hypothetical protein
MHDFVKVNKIMVTSKISKIFKFGATSQEKVIIYQIKNQVLNFTRLELFFF